MIRSFYISVALLACATICGCADNDPSPNNGAAPPSTDVSSDGSDAAVSVGTAEANAPAPASRVVPDSVIRCDTDCDSDGLNDCRERELGTNPCLTDTDGDGLADNEEVERGTDPLDTDTDSDGATDGEEVDLGLNPTTRSTYDDGVDDGMRWITGACDDPVTETVQTFTNQDGDWTLVAPPSIQDYGLETIDVGDGFTPPIVATYEEPTRDLAGLMISHENVHPDAASARDAAETALRWLTSGLELDSTANEHAFTTHDLHQGATGYYELTTVEPKSLDRVRATVWNQYMRDIMPVSMIFGDPGTEYESFTASVGVVRRADRTIVNIVMTPTAQVDDRSKRIMADLTNTTAIAGWDRGRETRCRRPLTRGRPKIDVYWVIDQSRSMVEDYGALRSIAGEFFDTLVAQQIDFRMGVTTMERSRQGTVLKSANWHTARDVFMGLLDEIATDPFDSAGQFHDDDEFGLTVAQEGLTFMKGLFGEVPQPQVAMRSDALTVTVFAADEESERFQLYPLGTASGEHALDRFTGFYEKHTTAFAITTSQAQGYRRVALATGGAAVPMHGPPEERRIVLDRFALDLAAKASTYQLTSTPITSTMHILVDGRWIPRSREHGYDYFPSTNSIVFFGRHQPTPPEDGSSGDRVAVMYEVFANPPK
jgi:hypothetical protein